MRLRSDYSKRPPRPKTLATAVFQILSALLSTVKSSYRSRLNDRRRPSGIRIDAKASKCRPAGRLAVDIEGIVDCSLDGEKSLIGGLGFEPPLLPFTLAGSTDARSQHGYYREGCQSHAVAKFHDTDR